MAIYDAPESLHVGNGVETVFGFNWPYLLPRDLRVTVNGVQVGTVLASTNQVAIVPAPPALSIVRIFRTTPAQNPTYLFATGIPMLPKYIDGNNKQLLYALQEGLLAFDSVEANANATVARSLRVGPDEAPIPPLPPKNVRAGRVLGFDESGNPVGYLPASGSGTELALDLANATVPGKGASMVGYMGRPVAARLAQTVYVKDYGAKGDNVTDDREAIYRAIRAAAGGLVVFDKSAGYRIAGLGGLMVFSEADLPTGVTIDFNYQVVTWAGTRLTDGSQGDRYATNWGVFTFRGTAGATYSTVTETTLNVPVHYLPAPTGHGLVVGDCVLIQSLAPGVDPATAEFKDRVVNRTARLVRISGGNLYFDNRFEFSILAGSSISYTRLRAVRNVHVKNVRYTDASPYDTVNKDNGASCVVFDSCEDCSAVGVDATGVPEHVVSIVRSRSIVTSGYANDPRETVQGGYFTQIVQSSHVEARDIGGRNERHIVDITASAYVTVERCGSLATSNATFTTHGAYEHNLHYTDCYGYMSFANSGATFGSSTRWVVVDFHTGANLNFGQFSHQGLSDATFNDCVFPSNSYISLDGVQFNNCTFATVWLAQNSARSARRSVFRNCTLTLHPEAFSSTTLAVGSPVTTARVKFVDSDVTFVTAPTLTGGSVVFDNTKVSWSGAVSIAIPMWFQNRAELVNRSTSGSVSAQVSADLSILDSSWAGQGMTFVGAAYQTVTLQNAHLTFPSGGVVGSALESTKQGGTLRLTVAGGSITRNSTTARLLTAIVTGAVLQVRISDVHLASGTIRVEPGLFSAGKNAFLYTGVLEDSVVREVFPTAGAHVGIGTVITI